MSGTLGDFLLWLGDAGLPAPQSLLQAETWPPLPAAAAVQSAQPAPGLRLWWRGAVAAHAETCGMLGMALAPPQGRQSSTVGDALAGPLASWQAQRDGRPQDLQGRFILLGWDAANGCVQASTDAFRTCNLVWASTDHGWLLASDLRLILATGRVPRKSSPAAIYQYLNFGYVPAPLTAIEGISKLPAGCTLTLDRGEAQVRPWWDARYPADARQPEPERVADLRRQLVGTVEDYRPGDRDGWGAFLSGGTDSSSICGILARAHESPVNSFSIGFAEEGYDELEYSRIASRAFGLQAHEYRVSEDDSVEALSQLVSGYDEPFGNASAIPTFHCARLAARHGVTQLVAGDGGDEIFGGNERYRKDAIFEMFHGAPSPLRWLGRGAAAALSGVDARWANRVKNFVHRGSLPNPDRFYSDDAFASKHFGELLSPAFQGLVRPDDALDVQRGLYARAEADHALHRLMYLDLKMTIADNDVVKVVRAARLAGVDVSFPYLDRRLIDFTGHLPWRDKLRGKHKRYLFKRAADDILPEAIRNKRKQGFGLPISVWLRRGGRYHDLVREAVLSGRATQRGLFEPGFVRQLLERHERGAWDHSMELHMLLMLELWHRERVDTHA
ncbi:MAG: hypothetical protein JNJ71_20865 [Rubrivivax sp.]|nr:hypothetical protein [Rubrivivax sp.]